MKSRKNSIMIALVIFISVFGLTYAFFNYYKLSERNLQLITGEIYLRLDDGTEQILLMNAFPETSEEARSRDDNFVTFSIVGKNTTTNKDVWYEIMLNEGDPIEGRNKLKLEDLRFDLSEVYEDKTEKLLIDAMSFEDLNARRIWGDTVLRNTTEEQEKTYKLRVWIREDILISDTDPNATYTTGEYANNYMSVKVSVFGDLTEKNNPYQKHYMTRLGSAENYSFWSDEIEAQKANITEISFVKLSDEEIETAYTNATIKADVSADENSNVKVWLETDQNDTTKYLMKVASTGITVFPEDSSMMFFMFPSNTSLKTILFNNIDTSQVTTMSYMFYFCSGLTSLNLSNFDTSQVTTTSYMFSYCKGLTSLNLSNFDTSQVTSMSGMFSDCRGLTNLDLRNFSTDDVLYMAYMFSGCSDLQKLDVGSFNTEMCNNMLGMFSGCSSLTNLDLSNFDTNKVNVMEIMFSGCSSLTSLNLRNFDTSNVLSMRSMFNKCSSLTSLDVSNFDTSKVTNMNSMFNKCSALTNLNISSFIFNDTLKGTANNYSSIFMSVGSNNDTPVIVTVNGATEQSWILGLEVGTDIPSDWTTDNVIIKTA